jgi:hypothetical protein
MGAIGPMGSIGPIGPTGATGPTGSGGNLQNILDNGNVATGANAKIGLTNSGIGYTTNPTITITNSNPGVGSTTGVPSIEYTKSGRNSVSGDIIASQHYYANSYIGTKTEFAKIETTVQNTSAGNNDGSIGLFGRVNGSLNEFLRIDGSDNQVNCYKQLDMNGQDIITSVSDIRIVSDTSSGSGNITILAKGSIGIAANNNGPLGSGTITINSNTQYASGKAINLNTPALQTQITGNGMFLNDSTINHQFTLNPSSLLFANSAVPNVTSSLDMEKLSFNLSNTNTSEHGPQTTSITTTDLSTGNFTKTTVDSTTLTFSNQSGSLATVSEQGFTNLSGSIRATASEGFTLKYGQPEHVTLTHDNLEIIQQNGDGGTDTIFLQNTGSQNPVINLQTNETTTNTSRAFGASVDGYGNIYTNMTTLASKNIQIKNNVSGGCDIQYTNTIDPSNLAIKSNTSIDINPSVDLIFTGASLVSPTSGGNSGQHLRIRINGTYYKIALLNDT